MRAGGDWKDLNVRLVKYIYLSKLSTGDGRETKSVTVGEDQNEDRDSPKKTQWKR